MYSTIIRPHRTVHKTDTQIDDYGPAERVTDRHGDEAPIHAAMQAEAMLAKGDLDGATVWRGIVLTINELFEERPGD